jgi:hypothetical protein
MKLSFYRPVFDADSESVFRFVVSGPDLENTPNQIYMHKHRIKLKNKVFILVASAYTCKLNLRFSQDVDP